jgi:hypothetical protein
MSSRLSLDETGYLLPGRRFDLGSVQPSAALGDEHRLTQSGGGHTGRPVGGRSIRGQFGLLISSACQFTTGRAARPHVA